MNGNERRYLMDGDKQLTVEPDGTVHETDPTEPEYVALAERQKVWMDAARLSHDRGADDPVYDELYRIVHQAPFHPEAGGISVHFSIEDIKRQKAVLAEAALSVPAPTLPALDALLREVWELYHDCAIGQDVSYPSRPELHPAVEPEACSDDVCARVREALRDAV